MDNNALANQKSARHLIVVTGIRTSAEVLPKEVREMPDLRITYYRYGFVSVLSKNNTYEKFKAFIEEVQDESEDIGIIAWSLGGVLVKRYIVEDCQPEALKRIKLIILVGTPSGLPSLFSRLISFGIKGASQLNSLRPSAQVNENKWGDIVKDHDLNVFTVVGAYDTVAPITTGRQPDPNRVFVVDEDHQSLQLPKTESLTSRVLEKLVTNNL